jgi:hypothetical protein
VSAVPHTGVGVPQRFGNAFDLSRGFSISDAPRHRGCECVIVMRLSDVCRDRAVRVCGCGRFAFQIKAPQKSFVVIAADEFGKSEWMRLVRKTVLSEWG